MIFPDSTLTNVGDVLCVLIMVGRESSTSEAIKIGLMEKTTTFGNLVRCYDIERTICDFLRTRNRCDEETVISAIKNYAAYDKKDLNRLSV